MRIYQRVKFMVGLNHKLLLVGNAVPDRKTGQRLLTDRSVMIGCYTAELMLTKSLGSC